VLEILEHGVFMGHLLCHSGGGRDILFRGSATQEIYRYRIIMIELGSETTKIARLRECSDCGGLRFNNKFWALRWLARFQNSSQALASLRRLLAQGGKSNVHGMTDDEVLDETALQFSWGQLHICRRKLDLIPITLTAARGVAPAFPLAPAARKSSNAPARVEDPPIFPSDIDAEAIAGAQREAAQLGIPFCEECVKAKLAQAAAEA
jgi:hypothetical protein